MWSQANRESTIHTEEPGEHRICTKVDFGAGSKRGKVLAQRCGQEKNKDSKEAGEKLPSCVILTNFAKYGSSLVAYDN
jgi:hypothetical protein